MLPAAAGMDIPTLCSRQEPTPSGPCRLCKVVDVRHEDVTPE